MKKTLLTILKAFGALCILFVALYLCAYYNGYHEGREDALNGIPSKIHLSE